MKNLSRRRRRTLKRTLAAGAVAVVVAGLAAAGGYHVFAGWRARDLAAKATANCAAGNYRMAWLQIGSARGLRPDDPDVLRAAAHIEAALGLASALEDFEHLAEKSPLAPADLQARAETAARHGTDQQAEETANDLEASGNAPAAANARVLRQLRQGDLDRAIAEARRAVEATGDADLKLSLARLLVRRHGPELARSRTPNAQALLAGKQIAGLVDSLASTPLENQALALGLGSPSADPEARARWGAAAMQDLSPDNPALLPAATALAAAGSQSPADIYRQLRPVFDGSPLSRRAAFALWLSGAGMPDEALTLVTAQESAESTAAFGAHTEALFRLGKNEAVIATAEAAANVDADVKLAARARAEYALGRGARSGANSLREAMAEAARRVRLESILPDADALGASTVADEKLAEFCGDPAIADYAFRVARDRLSRRGRPALLATAFDRARAASPNSAAAQDFARYAKLLAGQAVSPSETAAAVAAEPANTAFRITHALALLRDGKPSDALAVFDNVTIFANSLPPGQLAVLSAVLAANGDTRRAAAAARGIDPNALTNEEFALLASFTGPADLEWRP